MNYYLGIDGGGTKTAICLINEKKEILDVKIGKASSIDTVTFKETIDNIEEIIKQIKVEGNITTCFAGLGGIACKSDIDMVINGLKTIPLLKNSKVFAGNDIVSALISGEGKETGMAAIIGTGSVVYGDNGKLSHRCGGVSYQEGDPGSSFDLGIKSLRYLARVMDERLPKSQFSDNLMAELNCYDMFSLIKWTQKSRTEIAGIARIVTKYGNLEEAKKIIESGVNEIVEMAKTVYNKLGFDEVTLSVTGSLGNADTYYKEYLTKKMKEELPKVTVSKAKYEAYYGAALKALYLTQK